jgi:hypothetical protein
MHIEDAVRRPLPVENAVVAGRAVEVQCSNPDDVVGAQTDDSVGIYLPRSDPEIPPKLMIQLDPAYGRTKRINVLARTKSLRVWVGIFFTPHRSLDVDRVGVPREGADASVSSIELIPREVVHARAPVINFSAHDAASSVLGRFLLTRTPTYGAPRHEIHPLTSFFFFFFAPFDSHAR